MILARCVERVTGKCVKMLFGCLCDGSNDRNGLLQRARDSRRVTSSQRATMEKKNAVCRVLSVNCVKKLKALQSEIWLFFHEFRRVARVPLPAFQLPIQSMELYILFFVRRGWAAGGEDKRRDDITRAE